MNQDEHRSYVRTDVGMFFSTMFSSAAGLLRVILWAFVILFVLSHIF